MGGGGETSVSPPSPPSAGHDEGFSILSEILEEVSAVGIPDDRAHGNRKDEVRRATPFLILASSVLTSFGVVMLLVPKIEKRGKLDVSLDDHVPALPPVAAVRPSPGNIFFTAKTEAAFPSVSGFDEDFRFIDKFDRSNPCGF
jgi:hypothetical protein